MAPPPSPQALPDDLIQEILLRLPPEDPACLLHASLVCKPWRGLVSHPGFLRRLHSLHRTPPMLGFLHDSDGERLPLFVPSTARAFSLPGRAPERPCWWPIDCRQGRAVFRSNSPRDLLIWDLITGDQRRLLTPAACKSGIWNAAVVCAADGCDHRDCQGGAFRVVLIHTTDGRWVTSAWVYSSASGAWGEPTSLDRHDLWIKPTGLVVARNTLLYFRCGPGCIVEYDIASHDLMVIDGSVVFQAFPDGIFLTLVDEGVLGCVWSRSGVEGNHSILNNFCLVGE